MTTTAIKKRDEAVAPKTIEDVLIAGDLSKLTAQQRVEYYQRVCESLGLNPLTRPFDYVTLQGRLCLYAKRECTEQLRKIHGVSVVEVTTKLEDDILITTCKVRDRDGKEDIDIGAVAMTGLKGEARANATKKCLTQAKRRATLSICGLGWIDETETSQVPDARTVEVDQETGEIVEQAPPPPPAKKPDVRAAMMGIPLAETRDEDAPPKRRNGSGATISEPQRKRMWAISKSTHGEHAADVLRRVLSDFGIEHSHETTRDVYDDVIAAIESFVVEPQPEPEGYIPAPDDADFFDQPGGQK